MKTIEDKYILRNWSLRDDGDGLKKKERSSR